MHATHWSPNHYCNFAPKKHKTENRKLAVVRQLWFWEILGKEMLSSSIVVLRNPGLGRKGWAFGYVVECTRWWVVMKTLFICVSILIKTQENELQFHEADRYKLGHRTNCWGVKLMKRIKWIFHTQETFSTTTRRSEYTLNLHRTKKPKLHKDHVLILCEYELQYI